MCVVRVWFDGKRRDRKGGDPAEWPEDLRVREWPLVPRPPALAGTP